MNTAPLPDQAGEIRRQLTDVPRICEVLGIFEGSVPQARGRMVRCPWHVEKTPSCSVRLGQDGTIAIRCFGCGQTGDVLDLVAVSKGLDVDRNFPEVLRLAADLAGADLNSPKRPPPPMTKPRQERTLPPKAEVAALWAACRPVIDDPEVSALLVSRALTPDDVATFDLARALPADATVPNWAWYRSRPWPESGYRLLVPMHDENGQLRSVRARRVGDPGKAPKALPPTGYRTGGLVMADALGRLLLSSGAPPDIWPPSEPLRVLIAEGEPDFWTWATQFSDANEAAPAVLGIVAGSWTAGIAARIPDDARVIVWTDHDAAGEKYAVDILETLRGRCTVLRGGAQGCPLCPTFGWRTP